MVEIVDLNGVLEDGKLRQSDLMSANFDQNSVQLDVSNNKIGYEGVVNIYLCLHAQVAGSKKRSLKVLNLEGNNFSDEDIEILSQPRRNRRGRIVSQPLLVEIKELMHGEGEIYLEEGNNGLKNVVFADHEKKDNFNLMFLLDDPVIIEKDRIELKASMKNRKPLTLSSLLLRFFRRRRIA